MEKRTIYLPIEIKARELNSFILFSKFAIKKGFRVCVGSKPAINRLLNQKQKKAGVIIFKGGLDIKNILKIRKKVDHFLILDQEISPSCLDFRKEMKERIWPGSEKYIDRYYVIGKHAFNIGKDIFSTMSQNIVKTGWPSIDLFREENEKIFNTKVNEIRNKYGEFILFSSAFSYNSRKMINDFYQVKKNDIWDHVRDNLDANMKWAELTLKEFKMNIKALREIDEDKSCPQIIIRPHPGEDHYEWKKISKSLKNIKVIYEGDIIPWVYSARALLHRGCASSIQAYITGKAIGYPIFSKDTIKKALPYELSEHLYSAKDIIDFCKSNINRKSSRVTNFSEAFNNMIHIEKKHACENILDDIIKLNPNLEKFNTSKFINYTIDKFILFKKKIKENLNLILKKKEKIGVAPQSQKMPGGVNAKEIKDILVKLSQNQDFKVSQVFKDCVKIEGK